MKKPLNYPFLAVSVALVGAFAVAGVSVAQEEPSAPPKPPTKESVEMVTRDGVVLMGTYFRAADAGRDTPVVVMLPDAGESRVVFDRLAERLTEAAEEDDARTPMSVLSFALRGQGDSNQVRTARGGTMSIAGERLSPAAMEAMVQQDLEAVRRFLVDRNDEEELNLNRAAYFGVGMGAVVAANGAAYDWSMKDLNTGKQGKDVKALLMVSPPWKYMGLGMLNAMRQPGVRKEVAVMLMYGANDQAASDDAEKILKQLRRGRRDEPAAAGRLPSLMEAAGRTSLQGSAWLKQGGRETEDLIMRFLEQHVAEPEFGWTQRRLN